MSQQNQKQEIIIPFAISESVNSRTFDIYLNQAIIAPEHYTQLFDVIRKAGRHDFIKMFINSPGGDLRTGSQLISVMHESEATIITVLDGFAMSLAPLILFAGDEIHVTDNSMIMFHDFSMGNYGKGGEIMSSIDAYSGFYRNMLKENAYPFLSNDEIDAICKGQDVYFDTAEIVSRLDALHDNVDKKSSKKKVEKRKTSKKKVEKRKTSKKKVAKK